MGLIRGCVQLLNPSRPDLHPIEVSALADTGAVHLCIPEHLAIQLQVEPLSSGRSSYSELVANLYCFWV